MASERTRLGETLVALIARVEPFAVVTAGRCNHHAASTNRHDGASGGDTLSAAPELDLFATAAPRSDVARRGGRRVTAVVPAGVRLAAFIARAGWPQQRPLDGLLLSA